MKTAQNTNQKPIGFTFMDVVELDESMIDTPINKDAPLAPVTFIREGNLIIFRVIRCPFCGKTHEHGGMHKQEGDPRRMLGGRIAHCHPDSPTSNWDGDVEYRLIAIEGRITKSQLDLHFPMVEPFRIHVPTQRIERRPISPELRQATWEKTNGTCFYCGVQTTPFVTFRIDHFVPVAHGGKNDPANLVPACQTCNSRKSALDIEDFRDRFVGGVFWFERNGWV